MAVSTSTASRLPEISVEAMGDHVISLAPGGKSLVTTGIWALTKTSHCNRLVMTPPQDDPVPGIATSRSCLSILLIGSCLSSLLIIATRLFFVLRQDRRGYWARFSRSWRHAAVRAPARLRCGAGLRATSALL